MKILLNTFGSHGDLHPFLGLTRALVALGHQVTLATHAEYESLVRREGASFIAMPPSFADIGPTDEWTERTHHPTKGPEVVIREIVLPYLDAGYEIMKAAVPQHDLVVTHSLSFGAIAAAEKFHVPRLSVVLQPMIFFSAYDPPVLPQAPYLAAFAKFGPGALELLKRLASGPLWKWIEPVQELRRREGLPPYTKLPLMDGQFSKDGTLCLFPEAFASPQADWPPHCAQLGFPFFDEHDTATLSEGTRRFLEEGPPPVVFTLGSSVIMGRSRFFEYALAAMQQIGGRAIFLHGPNPAIVPAEAKNRPEIHLADYEPFSKLFHRAETVVHQCGIGTTAQALRSGRPQVLVPFSHDQPDNAARVARLGCGVVVPSKRLSTRRLQRALLAVRDKSYTQAARQAAPRFQPGDFQVHLASALQRLTPRG